MTFTRLFSALALLCLAAFGAFTAIGSGKSSVGSTAPAAAPEAITPEAITPEAISDIAEAHSLSELSGEVSFAGDSGEVSLSIDLASVETNIPIRNDRVREFLFEVARFPLATINGQVPADKFLDLAVGNSTTASVRLMLDLHGEQIPITAEVLALRVAQGRLMVTSTTPIIINAASVGLVEGIDKLQQLASLPSISKAVPVSFVLNFVR